MTPQQIAAQRVAAQVRGAFDNAVTVGFDGKVTTGNLFAEREAALARQRARTGGGLPPGVTHADYFPPLTGEPLSVPLGYPIIPTVASMAASSNLPPPPLSPIEDEWFSPSSKVADEKEPYQIPIFGEDESRPGGSGGEKKRRRKKAVAKKAKPKARKKSAVRKAKPKAKAPKKAAGKKRGNR